MNRCKAGYQGHVACDCLPASYEQIFAQALWKNRARLPRRRDLAEAGK